MFNSIDYGHKSLEYDADGVMRRSRSSNVLEAVRELVSVAWIDPVEKSIAKVTLLV